MRNKYVGICCVAEMLHAFGQALNSWLYIVVFKCKILFSVEMRKNYLTGEVSLASLYSLMLLNIHDM